MKVPLALSISLVAVASAAAQTPVPQGTVTIASTTVTSASPATVQLTIGGPTQAVMLTGTLLDRITAAHVESGGAKVYSLAAAVMASTGGTQREIRLTAGSTAQPSTGPLDLIVTTRIGTSLATVPVKVPLALSVILKMVLVHRDQLFGTAVSDVLQGASTSFTSCGTPAEHVFAVTLPKGAYLANGTVPRLEHTTSLGERAEFLRTHSINPTLLFDPSVFGNLGTNAHPSPVVHSVAAVRTCLEKVASSPWAFTGAAEASGAAQITVAVKFPAAVFRARGMPSDPTGALTALNVGIGWGHNITDLELPDFAYAMPSYEVRLPLTISAGKITYSTASASLSQQGAWTSQFLGPSAVRSQMEQYAAARMSQIAQEIRNAFDAANTRTTITNQIANRLQASHGITNVVAISLSKGDMWQVQYK